MTENIPTSISLDEILGNISSKNMTGRNSLGRGIRGDIEEYLGWHEDNIDNSPLSPQDRIKALSRIANTDYIQSDVMSGSDLKYFVEGKIVELMLDESDKYLRERDTTPKPNEPNDVQATADLIKELQGKLTSISSDHIKVQYEGYSIREQQVQDRLSSQIKEQKVKLYGLLFNTPN